MAQYGPSVRPEEQTPLQWLFGGIEFVVLSFLFCLALLHNLIAFTTFCFGKPRKFLSAEKAGISLNFFFELCKSIQRPNLPVILALIRVYPRISPFGALVEQLIYLLFLFETTMPYGKGRPFVASQAPAASSTSVTDQARNFQIAVGSRSWKTMNPKNQAKFATLVGESRPDVERHEILGCIAGLITTIHERGDINIRAGSTLSSVVVEGVPKDYTRDELMALLLKIDPAIDHTLQFRLVLSDTPLTSKGEMAETKQATIEGWTITQGIADFVATGSADSSIPRELCLRDYSNEAHAVELKMTHELRLCIKILEAAACHRRQIEGIILQAIRSALSQAKVAITVLSLRISTTRLEGQSAAGSASRIARRIACSEGKILLFLENKNSVSVLLDKQGVIKAGLKLGPMPRAPLLFEAWQSAVAANSDSAKRVAFKEREARLAAATTTPRLSAITQVVVRLAPEFASGVRPKTFAPEPAETALIRALGGIELGILAVLLQADTQNRAKFQGECTIWVGDIARDNRLLSKALVERLKQGTAAIFTETFTKIHMRGNARMDSVEEPEASCPSDDDVAAIIQRSLSALNNSGFVISAKMTNGLNTPLGVAVTGANPLSELGGPLNEGNDHDIRELFPSAAAAPTIQSVCKALNKLQSQGVVAFYHIDVATTTGNATVPAVLVRPALRDDWNEAVAMQHD